MSSEAWASWAAETRRKGRCQVCGATGVHLEGHHAVDQKRIKRVAGRFCLSILTDLRNHVAACRRCHDGHTSRLRPIPRNVLSDDAWLFAGELGLTWWLEKTYPVVGADPIRNLARGA